MAEPPGIEKRGKLEVDGAYKAAVLSRGTLRIFGGVPHKRGPPEYELPVMRCTVTRKGSSLEIIQDTDRYVFKAGSDVDARAWRDAMHQIVQVEKRLSQSSMQFLVQGGTAYKYNYSNSKRMRRFFWVDDESSELRWAKSKTGGEDPQKIDLKEALGIIYGPMTQTFQRCASLDDPHWCCFSIVFPDRSMDMAVPADNCNAWFLGLQRLVFERNTNTMRWLSEPQFVFLKAQMKIRDSAHRANQTTRVQFLQHLRRLGQDRSFVAAVRGCKGKPRTSKVVAVDPEAEAKAERKRKKAEKKALEEGASLDVEEARRSSTQELSEAPAAGTGQEELQQTVALLENQLASQKSKFDDLRAKWDSKFGGEFSIDALQDEMRSDEINWQTEKCSELEREVMVLRSANGRLAGQSSLAEKGEKQLKKVAKQLKESEAKVASLEEEVKSVQGGAQNLEQAKRSAGMSAERAATEASQLEKRLQELQQQLQEADKGLEFASMYEAKNKEQAAELARLEQAKEALRRQAETKSKELKGIQNRNKENERKAVASEGASRHLVQKLKTMHKEVGTLKTDQKKIKEDCDLQLRGVADSFPPLHGALEKSRLAHVNLEERYRELVDERKKLHNLVLELKGNIRVFVRVRPINEKEKANEPAGEATITFAEDIKLSVFEETTGRRKWFDFDRAFSPKTLQQEVFEEVKPLATSALDGFNVCIFAYGQTGSGKTFTMTGNKENPGLNTRVLTELFRIRDERKLEAEIKISLIVSEIYNEQINDLFVTKQKKLDVKQNADGTHSVPGITEMEVFSVEEVLSCMARASENRTVMATDMNDESSRSHSIVQVKSVVINKKDKKEYVGKINLVDLAGSENVGKSGVSGQGLKEAQNINKSLSALGDVMNSLITKSGHVPYRNSKLTMMLKDSLGGDSKTLMIVQCSPAQCNVTETMSSLNFAARARNVELGKAKRNVKGGE
mmetsp:Transcript_50604/g.134710  ORF Transcript_50604/g.134710 Transcript_50604/m.134710 type:complete len:962 (-) Transcript_50604:324-3209(-)|eukprot:CAMPEP_0194528118 /NCGR_PEP_ID=MMETSP0253-20130528/64444_1 /TAXON_ID=2966 /ORGANISM="Noctiluca scintillans" /LENGTH=961 /DNA_ID=CAMNT_0039373145 /DNA_START=22 /DNA_END=2907 /DNA_ORIENTATION=-